MKYSQIKILKEASAPELTFEIQSRDYSHGQHDLTLVALDPARKPVGTIDYSLYQGDVHVQMIKVFVHRQGIGTALVKRLQREYPKTEIDFGMLTDDGAALMQSIAFDEHPNAEYAKKSARLQQLQQTEAKWMELVKQFEANPSEDARAKILPLYDKWNDLNDEVRELEDELRDMMPSKRLVQT